PVPDRHNRKPRLHARPCPMPSAAIRSAERTTGGGAKRHRYYVSSALIQGRPQTAGSVARVPAAKVEAAIVDAIRGHIGLDAPGEDAELITAYVHRIEVRRTEIAITLLSQDHTSDGDATRSDLAVPWSKPPHRRRRDVIPLEGGSPAAVLSIRADVRV